MKRSNLLSTVESARQSISTFENIDLSSIMQLDAETAQALGVFDREERATVFSERTKEGMSLYCEYVHEGQCPVPFPENGVYTLPALLCTAQTTQGKVLLRKWLQRPSRSLPLILERQEAVACFADIRSGEVVTAIRRALRGIGNISRLSQSLSGVQVDLQTWKGVAEVCVLLQRHKRTLR